MGQFVDSDPYPELEQEVEEAANGSDARPVSSVPHDWTISTLRDKFERGQIDLQPNYQREYVWELKPELPSRLIESLLLQIPIPPIYFGKTKGAKTIHENAQLAHRSCNAKKCASILSNENNNETV